jgi:microcystin-dependent protein
MADYTALTKYNAGDFFPVSQWNYSVDNFTNHEDRITQNESDIATIGSISGEVKPFAGASVPTGFLECDGSAISRTTYATLFSAIGEAWGEGDGSTTFNIPDLRGRFLRGYDNGAGIDPDAATRTAIATGGATGDNVGSAQDDAMQKITGTFGRETTAGACSATSDVSGVFTVDSGAKTSIMTFTSATGYDLKFDNSLSTSPNTAKTSDNETRPINASIMFIIKT